MIDQRGDVDCEVDNLMMRLDDISATNKNLMENGCFKFDKYSIGLLILKAHGRYVKTDKICGRFINLPKSLCSFSW